MMTDPIADLLTRIRNSQRARHRSVQVRASKEISSVLDVLKKEGFIEGYSEAAALPEAEKATAKSRKGRQFKQLDVVLRYYESGEPLIARLERVSSPGQRVFSRVDTLPRVFSGLGMSIVSTSQGVMSDREARKLGIGGEVIARVG